MNSIIWKYKSSNKDLSERFDLLRLKEEKIDLLKFKWAVAVANISASAYNNKNSLTCEIGEEILNFSYKNKDFFEFIRKYRNIRSHYFGNSSHESTKIITELLNKEMILIKKNKYGFIDTEIESITIDKYLLEMYEIDFDIIIQFHNLIITYILKHL